MLFGGLGVVISRNPVHSALSLVATLFAIAVLFLNLDAQLLAAVQVIVYTGAIVVLILFVMMLLGVETEDDLETEPLAGQRIFAVVVGVALVGAVLAVLIIGGAERRHRRPLGHPGARVRHRRTSASSVVSSSPPTSSPFEITAGLLTIAVVGAVVLSRRPKDVQPIPEPESMTDQGDDPLTAPTEEGAH